MSNPNLCRFALAQHTPMVHFQGTQAQALIRATELKPKFDQYLFAQLPKIPEAWLVGKGKGEHRALDYKVEILPQGKVDHTKIPKGERNYPTFFANMGDEYVGKEKYLAQTQQLVAVSFFAASAELMKQIEAHFPPFIARTNFGTRQSKGFGSFSCVDMQTGKVHDPAPFLEGIPYLKTQEKGFAALLRIVDYYHQRLKSGINYKEDYHNKDHYHRAFLREYLGPNTDYGWEKRWVKEQFIGKIPPANQPEYFVRGLMGLQGKFSYKPNSRDNRPPYPEHETEIEISDERAANDKKKKDREYIARIKSPITFKPVVLKNETRIYLILREYTAEEKKALANVRFNFAVGRKVKTLPTPPANKFIPIKTLIDAYHQDLGQTFDARDYTGRERYKVSIHPWKGGSTGGQDRYREEDEAALRDIFGDKNI